MTQSTSGLLLSGKALVSKRRVLPVAGEVRVKAGDRVTAREVIARAFSAGDRVTVPAAALLGVEPARLKHVVSVKPGDEVREGQILARRTGLLGKQEIRSPASGAIEKVSASTGLIFIRCRDRELSLHAYVDGTVVKVIEHLGAEIRCAAAMVQGVWGTGGEVVGPMVIAADRPDEALGPDRVLAIHRGSVLVAGGRLLPQTAIRAAEAEVSALISGSMRAADFEAIETLGLTVILTEGFGDLPMCRKGFDILVANAGRQAGASGITKVRAGAIRPEVIIPLGQSLSDPLPPSPARLDIGVLVRIVSGRRLGECGTVVDLPMEPRPIATGAIVPVAVVEMENGEKVLVPTSNVEGI